MTEEEVKPFKVEEPLRIARLDPTFKEEIMEEPNAELIKYCFQCGTCTGSCIATRFEKNFNPRRIIKAALLGLKELVLSSDVLWICTLCYQCSERCPQGVKISEFMEVLRHLAVKYGHINPSIRLQAEAILRSGRVYEDEDTANVMREDVLLPPVLSVNMDEVSKILKRTGISDIIQKEEGEH